MTVEVVLMGLFLIVLLIVFGGMLALSWRMAGALHDQAKATLQIVSAYSDPSAPPAVAARVSPIALPAPAAGQGPMAAKPAPVALPAPIVPPVHDVVPAWFTLGLKDIGFHETGNNQGIEQFIARAHCGNLGDPWCAIWMNAKLEQAGEPGTRSASSQSFRHDPNIVALKQPSLGCVVVFWRGTKSSGQGHVGMYWGENATHVWVLGGNENDMVQVEALPKDSATFGLVDQPYFWPKSVPLPVTGPVQMPPGSPTHIQSDPGTYPAAAPAAPHTAATGLHTGIVATFFGGPKSAYGGPIDDNALGVALPYHFPGVRPPVRVVSHNNNKSIVCKIVDVGPWNTHDPYWETNTRPQAETGTDMTGRHTNKAGIDLTLAAANALGIDGKGLVDWEFVEDPGPSTSPKVT